MTTDPYYPIGTPGTPWSDEHKAQWLAEQATVSYTHLTLPTIYSV